VNYGSPRSRTLDKGMGTTIVRSYKRGAAPAQDPSRVTIEYWDPLSRAADPEIDEY